MVRFVRLSLFTITLLAAASAVAQTTPAPVPKVPAPKPQSSVSQPATRPETKAAAQPTTVEKKQGKTNEVATVKDTSEPSPKAEVGAQAGFGSALTVVCAACDAGKESCSDEERPVCDAVKAVRERDAKTRAEFLAKNSGKRPISYDKNDPSSAFYASYWRRLGIDPRKVSHRSDPDSIQLRNALGEGQRTAFTADIALAAVGGLQEFLQDRAKAESLNYTIAQLKGRLCNDKYKPYLVSTCQLLGANDLSLDEATLTRLKTALLDDLSKLPLALDNALPLPKTSTEEGLRAVGKGAILTVSDLLQKKIQIKDLPVTWAAHDADEYAKDTASKRQLQVSCSLVDGKGSMDAACWALLLPELGSAASTLGKKADLPIDEGMVAQLIEAAATPFCKTYGPQQPNDDAGACLLGAGDGIVVSPLRGLATGDGSQVVTDIKTLVAASLRFVGLAKTAAALSASATPSEIAIRLLPDVAAAVATWNDALRAVLPHVGVAPDLRELDRMVVVLNATAAAAQHDYSTMLAVLSKSFEAGEPFADVKLPPKVMKSLGFAARLAAAKTSDDAKKVFEDEAAPLGSYKVKYDREGPTIAVNAFVGPFAGYGGNFRRKNNDEAGFVTRPLSAPLGVDFTLASSKYHHVGVMASVIDPFAIGTVTSDSKAADFDWGAMLTPGLFARWGVGGSPFTALIGVVYQPLARSSDTCTAADTGATGPCWKGALQVGGAIAVDIPLLVLH